MIDQISGISNCSVLLLRSNCILRLENTKLTQGGKSLQDIYRKGKKFITFKTNIYLCATDNFLTIPSWLFFPQLLSLFARSVVKHTYFPFEDDCISQRSNFGRVAVNPPGVAFLKSDREQASKFLP